MPKEKKSNGSFGDYIFIKHELAKADTGWMEAANLAEEYPLERMFDLVSEGYKISFSPDFANMSIICTATDKQENSAFYKHILSGRGRTPIDAWYSLAYRHFHFSQGDWSVFSTPDNKSGNRFG